MEENFVQKTLSTLLEIVEVEFKIPLGFAEIKFPVTAHAKKWWKNKKSRLEVEKAIQRAEESFITAHPNQKVAQMLHELPLYSEEEFKDVIAGLLTHLSEEKITWLVEVNLKKTWGNVANTEEIRKALELYLPLLRHELNGIEEFRDIINARAIERIDQGVRRIESKLDKVLESQDSNKSKAEPDFWFIPHPYPMPPNFTGRAAEQKVLDDWLADNTNRLFILRALGGFGKSALAWQWINTHVNPAEWTKLVWWSFYEGDASFEHFIEETLKYLKLDVPQGQRPQVDELLKAMQGQKILLIMDGFERALRAYSSMNAAYQGDEPKIEDNQLDCVNLNAEIFLKSVCSLPNIKSKVLMTTRLPPRAVKPRGEFLQGCREEELTSMQPADAVEFFHKQGIKGIHAEIEAACAPYGYHPLSLRILARYIVRDFHNPRDIVVAQSLKIDGDLKAQKHHVLEVAYNSLPEKEKNLISTIACFRSSVKFKTLEAITENKDTLDSNLHDLVDSGLLNFDEKNKWFDLHPIVRRYAYDGLIKSDRIATHTRLCDYFSRMGKPEKIQALEDIFPLMELYYHSSKAERFDDAAKIYYKELADPIYFQFNSYQLGIELVRNLFPNGENNLPPIKHPDLQPYALNELGRLYARVGQPNKSILLREASINLTLEIIASKELYNNLGEPIKSLLTPSVSDPTDNAYDKISLSNLVSNLALQELSTGRLKNAEKHWRCSMNLVEETNFVYLHHLHLGTLLSYCGSWTEAEQELATAADGYESIGHIQMQGVTWSYISLYFLFKFLDSQKLDDLKNAVNCAFRAKELASKDNPSVPYDQMSIHWLLGTTIHAGGNLIEAEKNLDEALRICRSINAIDHESKILIDIAKLRFHQKNYKEAKSLAEEALLITERCGYILQGADVNLFMAQYSLRYEQDKVKAKQYAVEAKKLATCDGPPYYYKVAYEEAERFLEQLAG